MTIRPLNDISEFRECLDLQRECFGFADIDILPARFFVVLHAIGGLVLGALDGGRLIGFLNTIPALRDGVPYWHSQMMAVTPEYQGAGVGSRLKLAQREQALDQGIRRIEWTFDPLESRNAHFNLQKLGVIVRRYQVNYYGEITSALHHGLDSDRAVAEWLLDEPRPASEGETRRVFIPADIQSLKKQSIESARDIQLRVREQFLKNLGDGFIVAGFEKKDEWSEYIFVRGVEP
jgi:predicted GNAT superfamily acetyltransferase